MQAHRTWVSIRGVIKQEVNQSIFLCLQGRRSTVEEEVEPEHPSVKPQPLPVDPIPFDYTKHRGRYRRQESSTCSSPDSVRHVLFMLDTSGSIGRSNFNMMTDSLSKLVRHFCRRIKVAVMVFNHDHFLEFCFDCFDNNCDGRSAARDKMKSIPYRGGNTHTASAAQCACSNVLQPSCGFNTRNSRVCLDVVFITDGQSNDPQLDVCSTVECLHNTPNTDVTVYAFGIGNNVNKQELNCIASRNSRDNAIFRVDSFKDFSDAINRLEALFTDPDYQALLATIKPDGPDCFGSNPNVQTGTSHDDCSNA